jgi:PIN domain nuclease of toxin-antitoxin system
LQRFLIDTHALIWWWDADERLSASARDALSQRDIPVLVSCVTAWEIANKVRVGKLPQMFPFVGSYAALVEADGFVHHDLRHDHAVEAGLLPGEHRDPFDRLLAAQSRRDDLTIVTRDPQLAAFGCKVLW